MEHLPQQRIVNPPSGALPLLLAAHHDCRNPADLALRQAASQALERFIQGVKQQQQQQQQMAEGAPEEDLMWLVPRVVYPQVRSCARASAPSYQALSWTKSEGWVDAPNKPREPAGPSKHVCVPHHVCAGRLHVCVAHAGAASPSISRASWPAPACLCSAHASWCRPSVSCKPKHVCVCACAAQEPAGQPQHVCATGAPDAAEDAGAAVP
eukprot:1161702-Pelagomonas_calceolata.AAC.8